MKYCVDYSQNEFNTNQDLLRFAGSHGLVCFERWLGFADFVDFLQMKDIINKWKDMSIII